jgi:UDP-N-acetyl-D-glucosamine dehydrogenase
VNTKTQPYNRIAVVGLGYVGLPLALLAESKGFDVVGVDLDQTKLARLVKRESGLEDKKANNRLKQAKITFTDDFESIKDRDIVIICVPTPVDENKMPDLTLLKRASLSAAKKMLPGKLLVIESTINPGVCDEVVIPAIEKETTHVIGKSLYLAHCPERINPGDPKWSVDNINRVLGADSEEGLDLSYEFYSNLIDAQIKKMATIKEAEAVKIVENTFRDVNIAFVNELAMSFSRLGINVKNVIDGAATKPFAFMPHYPGIGIGGHCIPVDPYYLIEYARGIGFEHEFLSLARKINESMPLYAVDALEQALIEKTKKPLRGAEVAVLGLSYKANVGDDRESPAYTVIEALEARGAKVKSYDPYLTEKSSTSSLKDVLHGAQAVVLVTNHEEFKELTPEDFKNIPLFLDGRNIFSSQKNSFIKNGTAYLGIGV